MLTALGATDDKVSGFDAGADDYLVKPFEFVELIARVKALLKRSNLDPNSSIVLKVNDLEMDLVKKRVSRAGKNVELTAKEFALLEFMLRNKGRVLSKAEIASKVWDINFDTGTNVIEVYVNFLRKKIDKDYSEKLIQTKVGMGYVLKDD
jgi:DNA-binding response OmpR family regulator